MSLTQMIGDRYTIIKKVGGGGMAVVYLAKDSYLGREVALKVLREQYTEDPEFVRHFHKEARAVAALDHPNIVRIYDFDADGQPAYIVMEFVEGPTVKEMITEQGRLSPEKTAEIAIQTARGLEEAHRNLIVHKDVKSHNIMVTPEGQVKITDFGISQMLSNTTITHNKAILGSAHYFSPEQARGEHVSYSSDVYSLGIVMYEMLTGQVPFMGDNPVTVALKHIQELPQDPRVLVPDAPAGLCSIIMTCLAKEPADRFSDMGALANALQNFLQGDEDELLPHQVVYAPLAEDSIALPRGLTEQAMRTPQQAGEEGVPRPPKRKAWQSFLLYGLLIFLAAFLTIFLARQFLAPSEISVPDVEETSYERAANILRRNNLEIELDGEEPSEEVPEGYVIRQNPAPGTILAAGSKVGVVVSSGTEEVEIPDVRNLTLEEARNTLEARDLVLGNIQEAYSDSVAAGRILSQGVEPGDRVARGFAMDVVVSLGEEEKAVSAPDLRGQSRAAATDILANVGLRLGQVEEQFHDSVAEGLIISQSVNPGQQIPLGQGVNIVVSRGPKATNNENSSPRRVNLSFTVPATGMVSVIQENPQGYREEVYIGQMSGGSQFAQDYSIQGAGRFIIYLDGQQIDEVSYGQ